MTRTQLTPVWAGTNGKVNGPGSPPLNPNVIAATSTDALFTRARIAQPAATAEWLFQSPKSVAQGGSGVWNTGYGTISCPNGIWARIIFGFATITTVATGSTRWFGCRYYDEANIPIAHTFSATGVTASTVGKLDLCRSSEGFKFGANGQPDGIRVMQCHLPGASILHPGWSIGSYMTQNNPSQVVGLVTGDQWSAVELYIEYWTSAPNYDGLGPPLS